MLYRCVKVFLLNCLTLKAVVARGEVRLQVTRSSSTPALTPDTRVIKGDRGRCWYLHFGAEQLQPPAPGQSQHVGEVAAGGDGDGLQPPRHPGPVQVEAGRLN